MPKNHRNIIFLIVFFFALSLIITPVFADPPGGTVTGGPQGITLPNPLGSSNPSIIDIINKILNYLMVISVPILAFFVLWGGFQILTARGNPANVQKGGKTIGYAVAGFAIILVAKGIALILLTFLSTS